MARKEITFSAEDGRDKGKKYLITEMSASQAERWAMRVVFAIGKAGIEVPDEIAEQGMKGLFGLGIKNLLRMSFDDAEPLLDEMIGCVQRIESVVTRKLVDDDIEEITTRLKLRKEILGLHFDFFASADQSTSESQKSATVSANTLNIKMPRKQ